RDSNCPNSTSPCTAPPNPGSGSTPCPRANRALATQPGGIEEGREQWPTEESNPENKRPVGGEDEEYRNNAPASQPRPRDAAIEIGPAVQQRMVETPGGDKAEPADKHCDEQDGAAGNILRSTESGDHERDAMQRPDACDKRAGKQHQDACRMVEDDAWTADQHLGQTSQIVAPDGARAPLHGREVLPAWSNRSGERGLVAATHRGNAVPLAFGPCSRRTGGTRIARADRPAGS